MATATKTKATTPTTTTPTPPMAPTTRSDVKKVIVGSVFSRHSFGEVIEAASAPDGTKVFKLKNTDGMEWLIDGSIVEKELAFADQFDSEEKVSRTRAIEVIGENSHTAMTITFRKKLDPKEVAKTLATGQGSLTARTWNKNVKEALAGIVSTIIGYHTNTFDEHQRLRFIKLSDTDKPGPNFRLVDTRTVDSVIVARVKYTVK